MEMQWTANWIWKAAGELRPVNEHGCFRKTFLLDAEQLREAKLHISADSRYQLWVNGNEVGEGPIRSATHAWFYDTYEVAHLLCKGNNVISVTVWHFGHSNYQYIEAEAGLIAQLDIKTTTGKVIYGTDESWKYRMHTGYEQRVVKRSANVGWMEVYDANRWDAFWTDPRYSDADWENGRVVYGYGRGLWGELLPRDIPHLSTSVMRPQSVVSLSEIKPLQQVVSVNMRKNFYGETRDANAKVFSGYLVTCLHVPQTMKGKISFPHPKWNSVYGNVKIDDTWYPVDDQNRTISLEVTEGAHFFLVEICGIHDDLFCHIHFDFPDPVVLSHPYEQHAANGRGDAVFITVGPLEVITPVADGVQPVYGGVEEETGLNRRLPLFVEIGQCMTGEQLAKYRNISREVPAENVFWNQHVYSLVSEKTVLYTYPVTSLLENMLHSHPHPTVIMPPLFGGNMEFIIDFGKIFVGKIEFEIEAEAGTVVDFYGFESMHGGRIEYTEGLNNSVRYITREGRQSYKSRTRIGFRYLLVTLRKQQSPVLIYNICLHQKSYPVSKAGSFRCSDPLLNDIWEISRHTHHMCIEDTFVDCPTYEQVFWVGDCRISAMVNYALFGSYDLVRHCLEMVPKSRNESPLLLALFPTDWQAVIPFWTFSWIIACKEYVEHTADSEWLLSVYPEIKQTLLTYSQFINEKGLFDLSSWNFLDWASLDIPYVGVATAQQGILAYCFQIAAEMADEFGMTEDSTIFKAYCHNLKSSIHQYLWDERKKAFVDGLYRNGTFSTTYSVPTHVLLYLCDCVELDLKESVEQNLLDPPSDWVQVGSPFMAFYLFEAWKRLGRLDLILNSIRQEWGAMVRYGATTCWETFPGYYKTRLTRSHAHSWSTAPAHILGTQLLGITKKKNGYKQIFISPPMTDLQWVEGSLPTPYGRIDIAWTKEAGKKTIRAIVPNEIEVEIDDLLSAEWDVDITFIGVPSSKVEMTKRK